MATSMGESAPCPPTVESRIPPPSHLLWLATRFEEGEEYVLHCWNSVLAPSGRDARRLSGVFHAATDVMRSVTGTDLATLHFTWQHPSTSPDASATAVFLDAPLSGTLFAIIFPTTLQPWQGQAAARVVMDALACVVGDMLVVPVVPTPAADGRCQPRMAAVTAAMDALTAHWQWDSGVTGLRGGGVVVRLEGDSRLTPSMADATDAELALLEAAIATATVSTDVDDAADSCNTTLPTGLLACAVWQQAQPTSNPASNLAAVPPPRPPSPPSRDHPLTWRPIRVHAAEADHVPLLMGMVVGLLDGSVGEDKGEGMGVTALDLPTACADTLHAAGLGHNDVHVRCVPVCVPITLMYGMGAGGFPATAPLPPPSAWTPPPASTSPSLPTGRRASTGGNSLRSWMEGLGGDAGSGGGGWGRADATSAAADKAIGCPRRRRDDSEEDGVVDVRVVRAEEWHGMQGGGHTALHRTLTAGTADSDTKVRTLGDVQCVKRALLRNADGDAVLCAAIDAFTPDLTAGAPPSTAAPPATSDALYSTTAGVPSQPPITCIVSRSSGWQCLESCHALAPLTWVSHNHNPERTASQHHLAPCASVVVAIPGRGVALQLLFGPTSKEWGHAPASTHTTGAGAATTSPLLTSTASEGRGAPIADAVLVPAGPVATRPSVVAEAVTAAIHLSLRLALGR